MMSTASNSSLKQSCSALTSVTSALEVIFNVMRSINLPFTYLLTYLLTCIEFESIDHNYVRRQDTWHPLNSVSLVTLL